MTNTATICLLYDSDVTLMHTTMQSATVHKSDTHMMSVWEDHVTMMANDLFQNKGSLVTVTQSYESRTEEVCHPKEP